MHFEFRRQQKTVVLLKDNKEKDEAFSVGKKFNLKSFLTKKFLKVFSSVTERADGTMATC